MKRIKEPQDYVKQIMRKHTVFSISRNDKVDYSGKNVSQYLSVVSTCEAVHALWRCLSTEKRTILFQLERHAKDSFRDYSIERLCTLRGKDDFFIVRNALSTRSLGHTTSEFTKSLTLLTYRPWILTRPSLKSA